MSGFYKMLEIVMKLSRKLNYFKVHFVFEIVFFYSSKFEKIFKLTYFERQVYGTITKSQLRLYTVHIVICARHSEQSV